MCSKRYIPSMVSIHDSFAQANSVLFVCYGNICRSPFAEHYYRSIGDKATASAGVGARDGIGPTDDGIAAADILGLNMRKHRSQRLTHRLMEKYDIVFIFDLENKSMIMDQFPSYMYKIFMLADANSNGPDTLEDPYMMGKDMYIRRYKEIAAAIDAL